MPAELNRVRRWAGSDVEHGSYPAEIKMFRYDLGVAACVHERVHRDAAAPRLFARVLIHVGRPCGLAGPNALRETSPSIPERSIECDHAAEIFWRSFDEIGLGGSVQRVTCSRFLK